MRQGQVDEAADVLVLCGEVGEAARVLQSIGQWRDAATLVKVAAWHRRGQSACGPVGIVPDASRWVRETLSAWGRHLVRQGRLREAVEVGVRMRRRWGVHGLLACGRWWKVAVVERVLAFRQVP